MSTRSRSTPDEDIRMKDFDSPEILSADEEQTKPALGWDQKVWQPCLKLKGMATMFEIKDIQTMFRIHEKGNSICIFILLENGTNL